MSVDLGTQPQRPDIQRVKSTPGLIGNSFDEIPRSARRRSTESTKVAIQNVIHDRSNDLYRHIHIPNIDGSSHYRKRISFDTINVEYCDEDDWLTGDDEFYPQHPKNSIAEEFDFMARGRGRGRESLPLPFAQSPARSPSASPTRLMSPTREIDPAQFLRGRLNYPTTPIITHKGVNLTRVHRQYEDLYDGVLGKEGLWPVLPHRVILIYISGRKHTWVALDWILRNFIEQGDSITIVAATNHKLSPPSQRRGSYASPQKYPPKTPRVRLRQRSRPEYMIEIARNVLRYALNVINKDIITKVTVEIVDGNTKDALRDMYRLYEPNIVCTGSKTNPRNSAPLKSWQSSRLSDRLVKNFPLPVIVVPALNLAVFEDRLKSDLEVEANGGARPPNTQAPQQGNIQEPQQRSKPEEAVSYKGSHDDDIDSLLSENSVSSRLSSVSSEESFNSFHEIQNLYEDYKSTLSKELTELKQNEINEEYFLNFARAISWQSLQFCEDVKAVDPDFRGKGAKLAKEITGSNFFGGAPTKTKSLLDPVASPTPSTMSSGKTYDELKKTLTRNSRKPEQGNMGGGDVPVIKVESPSKGNGQFEQPPKTSTLKFADQPKKTSGGSLNKSAKPDSKTHRLKKFLSHEDRTENSEIHLKPTGSHPDIRSGHNEDEPKKKKKNSKLKFWKFF